MTFIFLGNFLNFALSFARSFASSINITGSSLVISHNQAYKSLITLIFGVSISIVPYFMFFFPLMSAILLCFQNDRAPPRSHTPRLIRGRRKTFVSSPIHQRRARLSLSFSVIRGRRARPYSAQQRRDECARRGGYGGTAQTPHRDDPRHQNLATPPACTARRPNIEL